MKTHSERIRREEEHTREWGLFTHILPRTVFVMAVGGLIVYLLVMLGQALNVSL